MSNVRRKLRVGPNDFISLRTRQEEEQYNNKESDKNNKNATNSAVSSNTNTISGPSALDFSTINPRKAMAANSKIHFVATKSLDLTGPHYDDNDVLVYRADDANNDDDVSG